MKVSPDKAIDLMSTLVCEDRVEVRSIRSKIINVITSLTISSFAITAFIIDKKVFDEVKKYSCLVDSMIIIMMCFIFWRLMIDLKWTRRALEAREKIFNDLQSGNDFIEIDPFPPLREFDTSINDNDMRWILAFGVMVVFLKILIIYHMIL